MRRDNVGAYRAMEDVAVECPDLGPLKVDIAYGGNFYAIVDPQKNCRDMADFTAGDLVRLSPSLRDNLNKAIEVATAGKRSEEHTSELQSH